MVVFYREEEEFDEDVAGQSTKSNDGGSHHANDSQANSLGKLLHFHPSDQSLSSEYGI